ncbi:MAG TPA: twin-arginine translocase TatA/TatE family subunit [Sporichthyaceae bacterium]|jgi:sec-independent protein translocase protein TatA
MGRLGTGEILLLALVVMLLFGAKRMPDMAKSLGESLHIFKKSIGSSEEADKAAPQQPRQVSGEVVPPTPAPDRTDS